MASNKYKLKQLILRKEKQDAVLQQGNNDPIFAISFYGHNNGSY